MRQSRHASGIEYASHGDLCEIRQEDISGRTVVMDASVADVLDTHGTIMLPGWVNASIARDLGPGRIKLRMQHEEVIGVVTDAREINVDGRIVLRTTAELTDTSKAPDYLALMRHSINRASVGFVTTEDITDREALAPYKARHGDGLRRVIVTGELREVSAVPWGSNPLATIVDVRRLSYELDGDIADRLASLEVGIDEIREAVAALRGVPTNSETKENDALSDAVRQWVEFLRGLDGAAR